MKKIKKIKKFEKRNWKDSDFSKKVRIKEEKLEYIKATKGKLTIAGRLDEILEDYRRKEVSQE